MKLALRIAIISTLVLALTVPVTMAQGQLRVKFTILDTKTKAPVPGVKCVAYQPERPNNKWDKLSDEEGEFAIAGLNPGVIVFELTKDGYQNARFNRRLRTGVPRLAIVVEIAPIIRQEGQATPEIVEKYNQGMELSQAGDHEGALAVFMELIKQYPDINEGYVAASTELNSLGRNEESIQMLEKVMEDDPDNTNLMLRIAESYVTMGDTAKATEWYQKIINKDPEDVYAIEKVAQGNYAAGNFEEAAKYFNLALEANPENPVAHYWLAATYYATDKLDMALKHFKNAIELDPEDSTGVVSSAKASIVDITGNLAKKYYEAGEFEKAFEYSSEAIKDNPDSALPHFYLGSIYYGKEDFANALKYFERFLELDQFHGEEADLAKAAIEDMKKQQ